MLSSVVIGGGPGGLGPLVWAAQQGLLGNWLDQGIALVERERQLGGTMGHFGINSDSLGGSYLELLEAPNLPERLKYLRYQPVACELAEYRESFPPLELVDRYMRQLGLAFASLFDESRASSLYLETHAHSLRLREDGAVAVEIAGPSRPAGMLVARSVVLAMGGRPLWAHRVLRPGLTLADCCPRQMMPSHQAVSPTGLEEANRLLDAAQGRQILILGGSHSAYSVAHALLALPAARRMAAGQIVILQRRTPKIFYADRESALADLQIVEDGDICPRTLRVNRMGGLRGNGRELWRRITRRPHAEPEPRVVVRLLQDFSADQLRDAIGDAALVVPCFGYRSTTLPVYDSAGDRLVLNADTGGIAVDDGCRLMLANGKSLVNVFGIGLGTGYRLPAYMGGELNVSIQTNSLWLYQNDIGELIYRGIQGLAAEGEGWRAAPPAGAEPLPSDDRVRELEVNEQP